MLAAIAVLIALAVIMRCLAGILHVREILDLLISIRADLHQIRTQLANLHQDVIERGGR